MVIRGVDMRILVCACIIIDVKSEGLEMISAVRKENKGGVRVFINQRITLVKIAINNKQDKVEQMASLTSRSSGRLLTHPPSQWGLLLRRHYVFSAFLSHFFCSIQ